MKKRLVSKDSARNKIITKKKAFLTNSTSHPQETPGAAPTSPSSDPGSTKRPRRSEGEPPKLTSSARNLLQLLTDAPPPTSPDRDVTAADDITSNLLSDTLDEVRVLPWKNLTILSLKIMFELICCAAIYIFRCCLG